MKKILLENLEYELVKDHKNGFDITKVTECFTDYFSAYDYILGDWAYSKLRLKGFCEKKNKLFKEINDYSMIDKYISENCAYDCKYFILKKK